MRKFLILFGPVFLAFSCGNEKKESDFELKGQFSNTSNETIYLEKLATQQSEVLDSAVLDDDGKFEFTGIKPQIGFYRIRHNQQNFAMLVLDSTDKVKVTGDFSDLGNSYKVEGSKETSLFLKYNEIARHRDIQLDSINNLAQAMLEPYKMDQAKVDSMSAKFEEPYTRIVENTNKALADKIMDNTDMYASIMAIQALEPDKYPEVYKALDKGLSDKFPKDKNVQMFHEVVSRVLSTAIGQPAPDIRMTSPDGKELALSDYRGKVVLIDFWASWCGPCRREMPNVVAAYDRFKNKGFEIFGVSLDKEKGRWVEAIQSDKITWPQVSDLKAWQSDAARLYNVQSIPYTVLVDREGLILAKNLRGAELEEKIAQVLSEKNEGAKMLN